jgi:hypothetical protein
VEIISFRSSLRLFLGGDGEDLLSTNFLLSLIFSRYEEKCTEYHYSYSKLSISVISYAE